MANQGPIRILAVDDHALLRKGIRTLISAESDMQLVAEASTGREAVEEFRTHRPDITIMDLQMPDMGGHEATAAIRTAERATGGHLPILALTAGQKDDDRDACIAAGADGYLAKPIAARDLFAKIESLVDECISNV